MLKYRVPEKGLGLEIEEDVLTKIYDFIKVYYPKEFGGVFIGEYSSKEDSVKLLDILTPKRFWNSGFLFIRYPRQINKRIKEVFETSKGKHIYVGEWHSHPNGSPYPSPKDISTMIKISNNKKVNIGSPILCIVSYDGEHFNHNFYLIIENNYYKYEKI